MTSVTQRVCGSVEQLVCCRGVQINTLIYIIMVFPTCGELYVYFASVQLLLVTYRGLFTPHEMIIVS